MAQSLDQLTQIARTLAEENLEKEPGQPVSGALGELASYIEDLRESLQAMSTTADTSARILPYAANAVADISQQAEIGVTSILDIVEGVLAEQGKMSGVIDSFGQNGAQSVVLSQMREIADRSRKSLLTLLSFLSFQDVIRQRAEKAQQMIEGLEKKTLEMVSKINLKDNEQKAEGDTGQQLPENPWEKLCSGSMLNQARIDDLLENMAVDGAGLKTKEKSNV